MLNTPVLGAFTQQDNGLIVIEAENRTFSAGSNPRRIGEDTSASEGKYIGSQASSWDRSAGGISSYDFTLNEAEEALIYLRKRRTGKSVWISIDGHIVIDHGAAVSLHFAPAQNVEVSENVVWDSGAGIAITRGVSNVTPHDNILHGMFDDNGRQPIYGNTGISISAAAGESYFGRASDIEMSHNNIVDSGGPWGLFDRVRSATVDCNVVVASPGATTWFNPQANAHSRVGKNSFYGGVRGSNLEPLAVSSDPLKAPHVWHKRVLP